MKNTKNIFFESLSKVFSISSKQKMNPKEVYWVIEEDEANQNYVLVKYFNEKNEVIFKESIDGILNGTICEEIIARLNQTQKLIKKGILI